MAFATDIYLDTYHLHTTAGTKLPTLVQQPLQGLEAPGVRISAYDNPGDHGETIANALYGGRIVTLQGVIRGDDQATYRTNRQAFQQACSLANDSSGFAISRTLQVSLGDGATYQLPVIVSRFQNPEMYPTYSRWQLELRATQWYLESATQFSGSVGLPQAGGAAFLWSFPLSFSGGGGGSVTLTNHGNATAYPVITLPGPVIAPVLTNITTGAVLKLSLSLLAGDSLVIDMGKRTIIQGKTTNKIGALVTGSTFWGLAPGDNLIFYSATQYDASTASFVWRDAVGGL